MTKIFYSGLVKNVLAQYQLSFVKKNAVPLQICLLFIYCNHVEMAWKSVATMTDLFYMFDGDALYLGKLL